MSGALPWTGSKSPGVPGLAKRRRREHAHRAREHRRFVGEDVAEEVLGQDHVEPFWSRIRNIAAASTRTWSTLTPGTPRHVVDDRPPQTARRHHVRLVDRGHPSMTALRGLERHPRYPLDLLAGVDGEVARHFLALDLLSEVRAAVSSRR
jgi:hypothetical protein